MQLGTSESFVAFSQRGLRVASFESQEAAKRFQERRKELKANVKIARVRTTIEEVE